VDKRDVNQLQLLRDYLMNERTALAQKLPEEVRRWLAYAVSWRMNAPRRQSYSELVFRLNSGVRG